MISGSLEDAEELLFSLQCVDNTKEQVAHLCENEMLQIFTKVTSNEFVINTKEDVPYSEDTFDNCMDNSYNSLNSIIILLEELLHIKNEKSDIFPSRAVCNIVVQTLSFASQFLKEHYDWSNKVCTEKADKIIDMLVILTEKESIIQLLLGDRMVTHARKDSSGVVTLLLQELSAKFNKKDWKRNICCIGTYFWILETIKSPHLSEYLGYLLPPALFIFDDWEIRHKILGTNAIDVILDNTAGSELRWYGRAEVIHEALSRELNSREVELLEVVYPVVIRSAIVLEKDPTNLLTKKSKYDDILECLIRDMMFEEQLARRSVYSSVLVNIITSMGITVLRWTNNIMDIFKNYLETYEGPDAQDRCNILDAVEAFVKCCWPRILSYMETLIKMLTKMVYEICNDELHINSEAKRLLLQKSKNIVDLIRKAAPKELEAFGADVCTLTLHNKDALNNVHFVLGLSEVKDNN